MDNLAHVEAASRAASSEPAWHKPDRSSTQRTIAIAGWAAEPTAQQALRDLGLQHNSLIMHDIAAEPPYPSHLLRLEDVDGRPMNDPAIFRRYWHKPPYAMPLHLVSYPPYTSTGTIIDNAVIGTRGSRREFESRVERIATRLVEDAIRGKSRAAPGMSFDPALLDGQRRRVSGRLDHMMARWRARLFVERWGVGVATGSLASIAQSERSGQIRWLARGKAGDWIADPFPCPGTDILLCERMPEDDGFGAIVAIAAADDGSWEQVATLLDEPGTHFSYPCTWRDGEDIYVLPEALEQGGTTLYRLSQDLRLTPVSTIAPGRRLADPTLFRHNGRYWIACTDVDIGEHDNLCLLHAESLDGPWQPHRCTPVKIDICGARPAGSLFRLGNALFRPGQDCAATYGAGVVVHRVETLTPHTYRETVVTRLRPDPSGPFPHGLHTLSADNGVAWLDGKRFEFDFSTLSGKILRRTARMAGVARGAR